MIQLLGLREFVGKDGQMKRYDAFFEKGWRVESVPELFLNLEKYIALIPEDERYNMFYTVANCIEEKRKFFSQDIIPIDIDGIEKGDEEQVISCILDELKLDRNSVGIVLSGNGIHILIQTKRGYASVAELRAAKVHYTALVGRLSLALFENGLAGKIDPTVFSESRILRLPFTKNIKPGKPDTQCTIVNRTIVPLDVDLLSLADVPSIAPGEHVHPNAFIRFPDPDTDAVLAGCSFIKHCGEGDEHITEPMWYAMLSIVGRLKDGEDIAFRYSEPRGSKHTKYTNSPLEVRQKRAAIKLKHALDSAGPRTCENISQMWEGCKECPHYKKITSPIQIVGEDVIRSQVNGFYNITFKDGVPVRGKPNYDDLVKYFTKLHDFVVESSSRTVYVYTEGYWKEMLSSEIHNFAEKTFDPSPSNAMCMEFESKLKRMNLVEMDFFHVDGKINFDTSYIDMNTGEEFPHSKDIGFTYKIPYKYEPKGSTKVFDKFISDVTCGDAELGKLLMQYLGYCISGTHPKLVQKCAIMFGDGSNGKSVVLKLVKELVGKTNCSSVSIEGLKKETNRHHMLNKLVNMGSETPSGSFLESDTFKAMVAGDDVPVRRLYGDPIEWECTTKLIFACNELPFSSDVSFGMSRRLLLMPFNATFTHENGNLDAHILDKLLEERSDIVFKLLQEFKKVIDNGYQFNEVYVVQEELSAYEELNDAVLRFVNSSCTEKKDNFVSMTLAYRCFSSWCDDMRIKPLSYASFTKRFTKKVLVKVPSSDRYRQPSGSRERGIINVAIDVLQGDI